MYESPENVPKGENANDIHFNSLMMSSVFPYWHFSWERLLAQMTMVWVLAGYWENGCVIDKVYYL